MLLTSHLHWAIEWPGHGAAKKGLDDMMGGVDNSPSTTACPLCNCIHRGSTTKMTKMKQSNGMLGWDQHLLILRVIPEVRAILNEGHKDIESVRQDACQSTTSHTESHASLSTSNQLQSFTVYSDMLCIRLHRPCDIVSPLVSVPLHMPPFVYLFN